jgi:hypothetical protein
MNQNIIEKIKREKELMTQLVERVRSIIEGEEISSRYLPMDITSFGFDYLFSAKLDELFVNQLELKYRQVHAIYKKIFQLYFEVLEYSYEGELNYKRKSIGEEEKVSAMEDLVFLEAITKEFITHLSRVEKREKDILKQEFKVAS